MRESCLDAFNTYVARYDVSDERIALKVEHTYEVAKLCAEIARGEGLPPADVDLAWLCGLLHDIGRFEQLCQWGTFSDADSCSHAALGIQVLKDEMGSFTRDPEWAHIIERAVALNSDFRLPSDLGARERLFCTITRDADKVDILRVFNQSSCGAVLGIDPAEFSRGEISDTAFGAFGERRCLARDERPGSLDGLVGAVCLAFELELPASRTALGDRGYLEALLREPFGLSPHFDSELTQRRWDAICDVMQCLPSNSRSDVEREAPHERLMNRLGRSEAEFDSGGYVDGNAFLDALLERFDA